jgi:tRNA (guanine-N7-)-methyltransferase
MRLRKIPAAAAYLAHSEAVIVLDELQAGVLRHEPGQEVVLEIGCGKGDFIIAQAQANPKRQHYALEKYDSVLLKAVQKAEELSLPNLTFILGDAIDLAKLFGPQTLAKIYLNFSDPWPKARHAKRRLTYRTKLALYAELLAAWGHIELKTDNTGFFHASIEELTHACWDIQDRCEDLYGTSEFAPIKAYKTEYEKKFLKRGLPIHYLSARTTTTRHDV